MRYRKLTLTGDYSFGRSQGDFLSNSPDTVAQHVLTRLRLWAGEWFLDITEGTPYLQGIIGVGTKSTYDAAIQARILDTEGVLDITDYSSSVDDRRLSVSATIITVYGEAPLNFSTQGNQQ